MEGKNQLSIIRSMKYHLIAFIGLIIAQYWLGMTINLEVSLPTIKYGGISALLFYMTHSLPIVSHAVIAVVILVVSARFLILTFRSSSRALVVCGIVGLAAVLGAIYNGIAFLLSDQFFGNSIGMAMCAVSGIIAYAVALYYIGFIQSEITGMRL
ncbi:MAG: hypothetical protein ACP5UZ_05495 [Thermoplasmata archaeon]